MTRRRQLCRNLAHDRFGEHDADKLHAEDDTNLPRGNAQRGGEQGEEGFDCAEYQILRGSTRLTSMMPRRATRFSG